MSVRRFDVKGSLGVGILEWFDDYFKFTRTSDSQILEVRWISISVESPAEFSQEWSDDLEYARFKLRKEMCELDEDEDEDESLDETLDEALTFATSREGPWITIHTSEGEIFGFQQVRELTDPPPSK